MFEYDYNYNKLYFIIYYLQGQYVKQKQFRGIMLSQLGFDDYCNTCECERFSVSNKIIDGWESRSFQECKKIDKP